MELFKAFLLDFEAMCNHLTNASHNRYLDVLLAKTDSLKQELSFSPLAGTHSFPLTSTLSELRKLWSTIIFNSRMPLFNKHDCHETSTFLSIHCGNTKPNKLLNMRILHAAWDKQKQKRKRKKERMKKVLKDEKKGIKDEKNQERETR